MSSKTETTDLELVCVIANTGLGSKIMKSAKKYGISGGTVLVWKRYSKKPYP